MGWQSLQLTLSSGLENLKRHFKEMSKDGENESKVSHRALNIHLFNSFLHYIEMSLEEKQNLQALRENIPMECDDDDHFQSEGITLQDVLDGTIPLGMSHAGGEYEELRKALQSELSKKCVLLPHSSREKTLTHC